MSDQSGRACVEFVPSDDIRHIQYFNLARGNKIAAPLVDARRVLEAVGTRNWYLVSNFRREPLLDKGGPRLSCI